MARAGVEVVAGSLVVEFDQVLCCRLEADVALLAECSRQPQAEVPEVYTQIPIRCTSNGHCRTSAILSHSY